MGVMGVALHGLHDPRTVLPQVSALSSRHGEKLCTAIDSVFCAAAPATAAITCAGTLYAYPACCPSRITLGGDTVNSLVNEKSLNELFYAINPTITPKNDPDSPLAAGLNVTVPCSRIVSLGIPS